MGIRKQPFGYRIEMGEIVVHPQKQALCGLSIENTSPEPHTKAL